MKEEKIEYEKQLQLQIHAALQKMAAHKGTTLTPEVHLIMCDLVFQQTKHFASELEFFSKHGKRSTVTADDVKLLLRNHPKDLKTEL